METISAASSKCSTDGARRDAILARRRKEWHNAPNPGQVMVVMQTDFYDAHERHWHDAEILRTRTRWANADHLYGFAAECGLKRLMQAFDMPLGMDGGPDKKSDRVHVDQAWARYEAYRFGHHNGAAYTLPALNPFLDWSVHQRYAKQTEFDEALVNRHRIGAEIVRNKIGLARADGMLP